MITVCKLNECTGCMACIDVCTKRAITVKDSLDAFNAYIDQSKCINCNLCHKVCQVNHVPEFISPIEWKEGWACDDFIRSKSSSGGVAAAIERAFIEFEGVVCSCTFNNGKFSFSIANSLEEIKQFAGSKYVKSNPQGCYLKIKRLLMQGKKVLFVGLPCQVAATLNFVDEKYKKNLYTIDLICHGTPSPRILDLFLNQYNFNLDSIKSIDFREKTNFNLKSNQKEIDRKGILDKYSMAFLYGISYTDKCYSCPYARTERISDITLGDSWGSDLLEEEQRKGISLVLCQTKKGKELLSMSKIYLMNANVRKSIESNHQLRFPSKKPQKRAFFFNEIKKGKSFNSVVRKCYPISSFKQFIKSFIVTVTGREE